MKWCVDVVGGIEGFLGRLPATLAFSVVAVDVLGLDLGGVEENELAHLPGAGVAKMEPL